jgi:hypothetical protein
MLIAVVPSTPALTVSPPPALAGNPLGELAADHHVEGGEG